MASGFGGITQKRSSSAGRDDGAPAWISTSIDNLDKADLFIRAAAQLPISSSVRYHSIIGQESPDTPLVESSDGLVPYWGSHLSGATSERDISGGHSVQETAPAIIELRRILHEDIDALTPLTED